MMVLVFAHGPLFIAPFSAAYGIEGNLIRFRNIIAPSFYKLRYPIRLVRLVSA